MPTILISNKTGQNIDLVKELIRKCPRRERNLPNGFLIEHIYQVLGYGTVISGISGIDIDKNSTLYLGPFENGSFVQVGIKNMHNDYRFNVEQIAVGQRGCLNIRIKDKINIRKGMILSHTIPTNICKRFIANMRICHHPTTIQTGYNAMVSIGTINEPARIVSMYVKDKPDVILNAARTGDIITVEMEFLKHLNFVKTGQKLVFREGGIRGIGEVVSHIPLSVQDGIS